MRRSCLLSIYAFCAVTLALPAQAAEPSYCDDPTALSEWRELAARYRNSDEWQRLHALWLGLCRKVSEGSLDASRADRIFERERLELLDRERQQLKPPSAHGPA